MFLRALLAFLLLPGVFAFLLPPLIAAADPWRGQSQAWGYSVLLAGAAVLLWCVRDFYVAGKGTLAPWSPPKQLVIVGLYRYARNPMYVGVLLVVAGWALALASALVGAYGLLMALAFHVRVLVHEERWLEREFGAQWIDYRARVPRWLPRLKP